MFFFVPCFYRTAVSCAVRFSSFRLRPDRIFRCELGKSKQSSYAKKNGVIVGAEIRAYAETNCCCYGLAPRRDALGSMHCAQDLSVRANADCVWAGGEQTCHVS